MIWAERIFGILLKNMEEHKKKTRLGYEATMMGRSFKASAILMLMIVLSMAPILVGQTLCVVLSPWWMALDAAGFVTIPLGIHMLTFYTDDDGERLGDAVAGGLTDALYAVIGFGIPTAIVAVAIALAILLHWAWAFLSLLAFVYLALFMRFMK
jgi:hypothetical protein